MWWEINKDLNTAATTATTTNNKPIYGLVQTSRLLEQKSWLLCSTLAAASTLSKAKPWFTLLLPNLGLSS